MYHHLTIISLKFPSCSCSYYCCITFLVTPWYRAYSCCITFFVLSWYIYLHIFIQYAVKFSNTFMFIINFILRWNYSHIYLYISLLNYHHITFVFLHSLCITVRLFYYLHVIIKLFHIIFSLVSFCCDISPQLRHRHSFLPFLLLSSLRVKER